MPSIDLRNKLLAVPGVSQVVAIGGELPEYQVNVRQDNLAPLRPDHRGRGRGRRRHRTAR